MGISMPWCGNATQIYEWLYWIIRHCVAAIGQGDYLAAFYTYVGMVILLLQWFPSALNKQSASRG